MNRREYLESKGYVCGKRGRFSADMLATLDDARKSGVVFDDDKPKETKPRKAKMTVLKPPPAYADRTQVRNNDRWFLISDDGKLRVGFDTCRACAEHIIWCECKTGPIPPKMFGPDAKVVIESA